MILNDDGNRLQKKNKLQRMWIKMKEKLRKNMYSTTFYLYDDKKKFVWWIYQNVEGI